MRELENGDIVNVDVTCCLNGYHGDLNETFIVGEADDASKKLTKARLHCTHASSSSDPAAG
jgi:methionyl aminopeptidase